MSYQSHWHPSNSGTLPHADGCDPPAPPADALLPLELLALELPVAA